MIGTVTVLARADRFMNCAVCGSEMLLDVTPGTFICSTCGFFSSNLPVRINADQRIDEELRARALKPMRLANFQQLLSDCAELLPPGARLLDVGCAHGWFMDAAAAHGMICLGIEPDREMRRAPARSRP